MASFLRSALSALVFSIVFLSSPLFAASVSIEAYPSSTEILEDENVSVEFKVSVDAVSASIGRPTYQAPDFEEVNAYNGSTGVESVFANGTLSVRRTEGVTLVLHPKKTGRLKITGIRVNVNGKLFSASDVEIFVHPRGARIAGRARNNTPVLPRSQLPSSGAQPSRAAGASFFVKTEPSKLKAYKGEQIILTYALYTRVPILQVSAERYPTVPGFLKEDIDIPMLNMRMNYSSAVVGGMEYQRAPLAQYAIYPVKDGVLTVDPLMAKFSYRARQRQGGFGDEEDPFGIVNQFFRSMQATTESRSSDKVQIEVLPLPAAGQPAGFAGLVGDFNITAMVDKYSLKAGESLNVTVKIDGKGHAGSLEQLKVDWPTDFELYEDKSSTTTTKTGYSERIFSFMLIPKVKGKYQIPSIEIAMFNPDSKAYLTRKSQPMAIEVLESDGSATPFAATQDKKKPLTEVKSDIRYWSAGFGEPNYAVLNKIFRVLALLSLATAGAGFFALGRVGKVKAKQDKHSELKEVIEKAERLSKMQLEPEKALFEAESLLAKAIYLVFSATLGSMTRSELREHLQNRGVEQLRIQQFESLLERCENLRFMPGVSKQAEAQKLCQEISQVLRGIQAGKS